MEKAGSFENLKIIPEKENRNDFTEEIIPAWKRHFSIIVSGCLFLLGIVFAMFFHGDHISVKLAFGASIITGGSSLFKTGFINLSKLRFDMKTLMTIAVIGAAIIGEWAEGAVVVILFAISETLERYSMDKARQSIRTLMDIAPNQATIRKNGKQISVDVQEIELGDIMIVKPGEKIAMDGIVRSGHSSVNQAAITGESVPVEKVIDTEVFAGTLNEEGFMEVEVTKHVEDTTIAKIIHLVEEAQGERAPSQAFVDRFATYYTPAVILVAILVAVLPPLFWQAEWVTWIYQGLAVLVVGCPCALVISTPVSIVTAIGNAAKHGVLVKGGVYLEELGAIKAVAFDKTGTLTKGEPAVVDIRLFEGTEKEWLSIMAALESRSQHPLAAAIIRKAEEKEISFKDIPVENFSSLTGKGVQGKINGTDYFMGSPGLFEELLQNGLSAHMKKEIETFQKEGKTVMLLGTESRLIGLLAVADQVRESSREVVRMLHRIGIEQTTMLTGDNRIAADAIGSNVGVKDIQSELLPEEKLDVIKQLSKEYGKVAMVGDGVNDAPALAASTVGIAMGGAGTDTALETADVALMGDDLTKLPFAIKLSRKALFIIKQNIGFSLGIKLVALLLVVPGWLTLWIAILADMGATLLVTANGLRLLKIKDK